MAHLEHPTPTPEAASTSVDPARTVASSPPSAYATARELIDEAHRRDPEGKELGYADQVESWVFRLAAAGGIADGLGIPEILRLAARCQHLERFDHPRSEYPEGKAGYLKWRRDLYTIQANRAVSLLSEAGISEGEQELVRRWVSKTDLRTDAGSQALEDAAVLVFLESQLGEFKSKHEGTYDRAKFVDILTKTWRKLTDSGKAAAKGLSLPPDLQDIVREATAARS